MFFKNFAVIPTLPMSLHWLLQSSILLLELLGPAIGCSAGPISSERRIVDWERTTNSFTKKECFNIRCALNQGGSLRLISIGYFPSRFQYSWSSNSVNSPTVFRMAYLIPDPSLVVVYLCCITWPACKSLTKNMFNVLNTFDDRSVPYCVAAKIKEKPSSSSSTWRLQENIPSWNENTKSFWRENVEWKYIINLLLLLLGFFKVQSSSNSIFFTD